MQGWLTREKHHHLQFFWWVLYKMGHSSIYTPSDVHWCRIYRIRCTPSMQHPYRGNEVSPICSLQTDGMGAGVWFACLHVLPILFPPHFCDDAPPPLPKVPQNGISMMYIIVLNCRLPISHPDKQYQSGTPVNTIVRKDFKIVLQLGTFTVLTNPHQMNRMLLKQ